MRRRAVPAALAATGAVLLAACGGSGADRPDTALARDLTLASSAVRPALDSTTVGGDTAAARPRPLPAPPIAAAPPRIADAEPRERPAPARATAPVSGTSAAPVRRAPAPTVADAPAAPDAAPATAPATAAAAASDAPGAGAGRSIAAGTLLAATLGQRVCSESNRPGDRFVATLGADVTGPGGATLPAGTPIVLELARATTDPPSAEFLVRGLSVGGDYVPVVADAQPVTGEVERRQVVDKAGSAKGKAVQGAVVGAILGRVLGGGTRGTVIGAAGGAAAGAAMGRGRTHEEACLTPGAAVRVRLSEALTVR